jgi:hypothetical protein
MTRSSQGIKPSSDPDRFTPHPASCRAPSPGSAWPGLTSLLDWDEAGWLAFHQARPRGYLSMSHAFIQDTRFELEALLIGDDPGADQYPRDSWDVRHLGVEREQARWLHFDGITQPWLKDVVKRWCRWRLAQGINAATIKTNIYACARLAAHLAELGGPDASPAVLTRERLETWIAALHPQVPDPSTRSHQISSISTLFKDIHRHEWLPDLPGSAFIYHDDGPRPRARKPRFIPEPVMRQLERPEALAKFPSDDGRMLLELLIACGLRLKDARWLPFDCIVRDASGNPYLAWLNRKQPSPTGSPFSRTPFAAGSRTGRHGCSLPPTPTSTAASRSATVASVTN